MLSILIPSHNEKGVHDFVDEVEALDIAHEIIICNDRYGRGKGWAIREGLAEATGEIVAFIDGDGDIPARMLLRLLPFLDDFDIVVGSKRIWNAPWQRKILTHLSRIYIWVVFGLRVDTQTGVKIFKREAVMPWVTNGFFFDVEVLARAVNEGFKVIEVPIKAEIKKQVSAGALWRTLVESVILWFRLLFLVKQ